MKKIPLTQGKVSLVDDDDFEYLNQFNWHMSTYRELNYAKRNVRAGTSHKLRPMHREIFEYRGIDLTNLEVDHINGDGLDNRRSNLRLATHKENLANCAKRSATRCKNHGFKGITFNPKNAKWVAQIAVNGKHIECGEYNTPSKAANAYDDAAVQYFGKFAKTNEDLLCATSTSTESPDVKYSGEIRKKPKSASSTYRGVNFNKQQRKWFSRIRVSGKEIYCGTYPTEEDAARAYNDAVKRYFGLSDPRINKLPDEGH
jgi:hypothetical protein